MADDHELEDAFRAYCDAQLALQRAEEQYAEAERETRRPLIEAKATNKEARNRLADAMQRYGVTRIVL